MKSFQKKYEINASSAKVFEALTSARIISEWSGANAVMRAKAGVRFSLWGGSIHGENIIISQEKIQQNWKEEGWDDFSEVIFEIQNKGKYCEVILIHNNIPDKSFRSIKDGWDEYYMGPLIEWLQGN